MSQVSYGTITITDTTDKIVYIGYANDAHGTNLSNQPSAQRIYIGININATDYSQSTPPLPPANDSNWTWSEYVGGDGVSVLQTKQIYFLKRTTDSTPSAPGNTTNVTSQSTNAGVWTAAIPTYILNATYYVSTQTDLDNGLFPHSTAVIDQALTDANYNAYLAQSLSQDANENANGAMSQAASNVNEVKRIWYAQAAATPVPSAPSIEVTATATHDAWSITKPAADESYPYYFYCDQTKTGGGVCSWSEVILDTSTLSQYQIGALTTKVRNYWWDSAGAHIASGTSNSGEISATSPVSNYGYNTLTGLTGISFKYNDAKIVDLNSTTPSLDFYQPPTISGGTVTQGKKTMMLSANALRFYNPTDGTTEQAKLDSNGLKLLKGGIEAGTPGASNFVYLSTNDYPLRQYVKTTDVAIDNQKTYYTFNDNTYTAVTSPDVSSISDYYECVQNGLTINEHTPTQNTAVARGYILTTDTVVDNQKTYYTYDSANDTYVVVTNPISGNLSNYYEFTESFTSDSAWREVIGSNFGVDSSGNLYASNAVISGEIHATSGTIAQGIIIGNANGAHITTTNEGIEFWNNGIKTAYINGNYMYIPYSVVLNEMIVGQRIDSQTEQKVDLWSWKKMSNENLRLMWLGGEVE